MIFAIYRNHESDPSKVPGKFTMSRLYLASPEVDDASVLDLDRLQVIDDTGERVWIVPGEASFEYPEEVYAAVVKRLGARVPGEVVVVDGADDGGDFLNIKGSGYVRAKYLQLLDSTLVKPGMVVYDRKSSRWQRVRRVDECLRLVVEGNEEMRVLSDFVFAVSDEELATVPLLRCKDASGHTCIREGAIYRVTGLDEEGDLLVVNDKDEEKAYDPERFEFV